MCEEIPHNTEFYYVAKGQIGCRFCGLWYCVDIMWVDWDVLEEHEDGGNIYLQNVSLLCQNSEMQEMHSSYAVYSRLQENRQKTWANWGNTTWNWCYEGHLESKERFAIKKYLLIIGKKKNMQVLSHTFTYFST